MKRVTQLNFLLFLQGEKIVEEDFNLQPLVSHRGLVGVVAVKTQMQERFFVVVGDIVG